MTTSSYKGLRSFISLSLIFFFFTVVLQAQSGSDFVRLSIEGDLTYAEIVELADAYFEEVGTGKGVGYKPYQRWKEYGRRNLGPDGKVISDKFALDSYNKFKKEYGDQGRAISGTFTDLGPESQTNTSTWSSGLGRVTSVSVDPNDNSHILIGAPNGGAWTSDDTGSNWTALFQDNAIIDVFAVEISHANSDHYFLGTAGSGIYRSTDGGTTWTQTVGINVNQTINTLIMHPSDANILLATGTEGVVYRSTNGGNNWTAEYTAPDAAYDIEFKPSDATTLYASGNGWIARSTDTGNTWSPLASGGTWSTSSSRTIMLGVTPANGNYVYALQENSGGFSGLYLSTNSGTSWAAQMEYDGTNNIMGYEQDVQSGQAPRDMDVVVSPTDETLVHVAGIETWKSSNSGTSFSQTTYWDIPGDPEFVHADVDMMYFAGSRLYAATDGGIYYSDDQADSWTNISSGVAVREFYRIGASETVVDRVAGGSQDNGAGVLSGGVWLDWLGADGMETFIDWSNANIIYGNTQNGSLYKSIDGGNSYIYTPQTTGSGAWITPCEQDPTDPNTLYQCKGEVYKSTDGASSWAAISSFGLGTIYEMKVAPSNNQVMYANPGNDLYVTTNGGTSWTDVTPPFGGYPLYITIHPTDPNRVLVNLGGGASSELVESLDGGSTWTDISANLPAVGSMCAAYENDSQDGMFVGMNPGLYFKDNTSGGTFTLVNSAMPVVSVTELDIRNGTMYIATYGRGLWKVDLAEGAPPMGEDCEAPATVFDGSAPITSTINIAEGGLITDVNISLDISHTWVGDIIGTLTHDGVTINLLNQPGSPALSLDGCVGDDIVCTLDDESPNGAIEDQCEITIPAIAGVFTPDDMLSAFDGMDASGDWILTLDDAFPTADNGTLNGWCVVVEREEVCEEAIAIPDGDPAGVSSTITLTTGGTITDVDIEILISHEWIGDVSATLSHLGTTVSLFDQPGVPASTFGCSGNHMSAIFDDESVNGTIEGVCGTGVPSIDGDYNPDSPLSAFDGMDRAGDWILTVYDATTPDPGTVDSWCLEITADDCAADYAGGNALSGNQNTSTTYTANGDIESTQTIVSPVDVIYDSATGIYLNGDFEVQVGAIFETKMDGCP